MRLPQTFLLARCGLIWMTPHETHCGDRLETSVFLIFSAASVVYKTKMLKARPFLGRCPEHPRRCILFLDADEARKRR